MFQNSVTFGIGSPRKLRRKLKIWKASRDKINARTPLKTSVFSGSYKIRFREATGKWNYITL
jgi:hypothetical protein